MPNIKILIVINNSTTALDLKVRLQELGYHILDVVFSLDEASLKAEDTPPDLIIVDLKIVGSLDTIEGDPPFYSRLNIPLIYLVDDVNRDTSLHLKDTEPFSFIQKPFTNRELQSAIERAIYKHNFEKKIQTREEQYRQLVERIPVGIYRSTSEGNLLTVNTALVKMLGYENQAELLKVNIDRDLYFDPEERTKALKKLNGNTNQPVIFRLKKSDGSKLWVEDHGKKVLDDQGKVKFYEGVLLDISKRKQMEDALREREQRFRASYQKTPVMMHSIDNDKRLIQVSNYWLEVLGYERDEVIGRESTEFLTERSRRYVQELAMHEFFESGSARDVPLQFVKKDGEVIDVLLSAFLERDGTKNVKHALAVLTDVTERNQAEKALKESEEKFRTLAEQMPSMIFINKMGQVLYTNQASVNQLGYTKDEYYSDNFDFLTLIAPENRELVKSKFDQHKQSKEVEPYECTHLTKNGKIIETIITTKLIDYEGDKAILGIVTDITERKQNEMRLMRLATAVEQSDEIILITDTDGIIQYVNPAFERVTGYTREEAIGQNPRFLKSGKHEPQFYKKMWHTLTSGNVWSGSFINKKKDGTLYEEEATISPIRDTLGNVINFVAVKRDRTKEIMLEKQLHQAQKMETIGTLAGGVAHDFNNLLTVILGNVEFGLQDCQPEEPVYNDLKKIEHAGLQARDLVKQLLSFTRQQVLNPKPLNLNHTIEELLRMLKRIIGEDIELSTNLAPQLHSILADKAQIQQVLMNLCTNARDAMPNGGKLIFETRNAMINDLQNMPLTLDKSKAYIELTITDTGVGMDKDTQDRIFEPFFTTKEIGKGTGLGLAVVYGIVKQHNGHIDVSSQNGETTTFKIILPALTEPVSAPTKKNGSLNFLRGQETILVVEDEEAVRNVINRILDSLGYTVLTAENSYEAMKLFDSHKKKISLVILDVILPNISGPEIYSQLTTIQPDLPVLFVTGYDRQAKLVEFSKFKSTRVLILQKPFTKEVLGQSVRELLDKQR